MMVDVAAACELLASHHGSLPGGALLRLRVRLAAPAEGAVPLPCWWKLQVALTCSDVESASGESEPPAKRTRADTENTFISVEEGEPADFDVPSALPAGVVPSEGIEPAPIGGDIDTGVMADSLAPSDDGESGEEGESAVIHAPSVLPADGVPSEGTAEVTIGGIIDTEMTAVSMPASDDADPVEVPDFVFARIEQRSKKLRGALQGPVRSDILKGTPRETMFQLYVENFVSGIGEILEDVRPGTFTPAVRSFTLRCAREDARLLCDFQAEVVAPSPVAAAEPRPAGASSASSSTAGPADNRPATALLGSPGFGKGPKRTRKTRGG